MNRIFLFFVCFAVILLSHAHSQPDKHHPFLISSDSSDAKGTLVADQVTYTSVGSEFPFERLWSESQITASAVVITRKGTILVGCGSMSGHRIVKSTDRGQTWKDVGSIFIYVSKFTVNDSGSIYASGQGNLGQALLRSRDDGETWEPIVGSPPSGLVNLDWGFDLAISPKGDYFFATNEGMWRSLGGDSSWTPINNGIPPHRYRNTPASVNSLVFLNNKIFIVRSYGMPDSTNSILVSTDNGDSWSPAGTGIPEGTPLATLLVHDNLLLAGGMYIQFDPLLGPNSLYVSKDSGASWEVSCPNLCVHRLQQNTRGDLYAATDISQLPTRGGVYRSLDNGATWEFAGLDSRNVWDIIFDNDGYCFAATQSYSPENNGLFRSLNPIPWAVSPSPAIAHSFTLFQNYPNPFNPSTKIRFSLPRASNVFLRIYNTLGQEVTQILSQHLNAGSYTTEWNASGFASGIYYCRLEAGSFVETNKLVLLR